MKRLCMCAALSSLATPAFAMPTAEFIARWHAASRISKASGLSPREVAALPEIKTLGSEFASAAYAYRQQILAARAAGRLPRACPPKDVDLSIDGIIADVERLPNGWQSRDLSDTLAQALDRRHPCGTSPVK